MTFWIALITGLAATGTILPPSSAPAQAPGIFDELSDVKIHENGTTSGMCRLHTHVHNYYAWGKGQGRGGRENWTGKQDGGQGDRETGQGGQGNRDREAGWGTGRQGNGTGGTG